MAQLYALKQIILPGDVLVAKGEVFETTPANAKSFDALGAARPASKEEVKAAEAVTAAKNGAI